MTASGSETVFDVACDLHNEIIYSLPPQVCILYCTRVLQYSEYLLLGVQSARYCSTRVYSEQNERGTCTTRVVNHLKLERHRTRLI